MSTQSKQIKASGADTYLRISRWCAYQERSQHEARMKLALMGIKGEDAEALIARLVGDGFINEERFAVAFAGGRFRLKRWGKIRIKAALQHHRLSAPNIERALYSIADEDYRKAIALTIEKKLRLMPFRGKRQKYAALLSHAVSRGFESELVREELNRILGEQEDDIRT
jgi:regulatory protein